MNLGALLLAAVVSQGQSVINLELVTGGLTSPVAVAHTGDSRLFIVEQIGRIRVFDTTLRTDPFLDIRSLVSSGGERGLLGVAFHPRYAENGFFYVNYTNTSGDTVIARYTRSATDPNRADPNSRRQILTVDQPFSNHNGGQLEFGPDGYLYIGLGDGGSGGDPDNRAQNLGDLLGKMLRIDVDTETGYAIPPSNPFVGRTGARPEIWASGLRNPWRYSFDRLTGDLWIADVGQGLWEEVSFQPATSIGGENYGWKRMEGTHCFSPPNGCNNGTLVLPVIEYDHSGDACSVTGGYVYRGTRNPHLAGLYLYGDYCSGEIWGAFRGASGAVQSFPLLDTGFFISTFGQDSLGEVYVADHRGGVLYRIVDPEPVVRRRSVRK